MKRLNYFFSISLLFCIGIVGSSNIDLDTAMNPKRQLNDDNIKALTNGEEHLYKSFSSGSNTFELNNILGSCTGGTLLICGVQCVVCGAKYFPDKLIHGSAKILVGEQCPICGSYHFRNVN